MSSETEALAVADYFPTEPWLEKYREALDADEQLGEKGAGWGVDWEGGMVFHMENLPLAERTVGDQPEELVGAIEERFDALSEDELEELVASAPEDVQADVDARSGSLRERARAELLETPLVDAPERTWPELRAELPDILADLLDQLEENVVDGDTVYTWLDLYDGGCRDAATVQDPDERHHGFVIRGDYDQWKDLTRGEADVINLLMGGKLELEGDMQKILQYTDASVRMTEISAELDSRYLF